MEIKTVGCIGYCYMEPLVGVERDGKSYTYGSVDVGILRRIIEEHVGIKIPW